MGRNLNLLITGLLVITLVSAGNAAMTTLPQVQLPLAPPAKEAPFDDDEFFDRANTTIYKICTGEPLPAGKMNDAVHDSLAGTYYTLIRMNVSQEQYPRAEEIVSFLSYTLTLMEKYQDYESEQNKFSPVNIGITPYEDLVPWYDAAAGAWKEISGKYPGARMYGMPSEIGPRSWIIGEIP
jgi:hypothetical protein